MRVAKDWYPYIGDGTWPDCDMIPLGHISIRGERGAERDTRLTPDEQYSLMTFFTIFRSPLMFGGDLPSNDEFTLSLLTNEEVLKMHREGTDVHEVSDENGILAVSSTNSRTGDIYLAVFNKNNEETSFNFNLEEALGLKGARKVTVLWEDQKIGRVRELTGSLRPHASFLFKISK